MIHLLPSVRIKRLSMAAGDVIQTLLLWEGEITITSANDGKHASDSRHYLDRAFDIRTRDKDDVLISRIVHFLFANLNCIRIKIELSDTDKHWVKSADEIRFPEKRSANQHIHLEWEE